jgi:hypothetical protein
MEPLPARWGREVGCYIRLCPIVTPLAFDGFPGAGACARPPALSGGKRRAGHNRKLGA